MSRRAKSATRNGNARALIADEEKAQLQMQVTLNVHE